MLFFLFTRFPRHLSTNYNAKNPLKIYNPSDETLYKVTILKNFNKLNKDQGGIFISMVEGLIMIKKIIFNKRASCKITKKSIGFIALKLFVKFTNLFFKMYIP